MKPIFTEKYGGPRERKYTLDPDSEIEGGEVFEKIIDLFHKIAELVPNCVLGWQGIYDDDGKLLVNGSTLVSTKRLPKNMMGVKVKCDVDENGEMTELEKGRIAASVASMAIMSICDEYGMDLGVIIGSLITLGAARGDIADLAKVMEKDDNLLKNAKKVLPKEIYDEIIKPLEDQQDD